MNLTRREELKAKKQAYVQDEILAAAATLFAEGGVRGVTIDHIALSLGYTKSVVYYYFKNKNQVLWEIFNKIHDHWWADMASLAEAEQTPDLVLASMIRQHALNVMDRASWSAIYFRDQGELTDAQQKIMVKRKRDYDRLFRTVYQKGVDDGLFQDIPSALVVSGIIGMCNFTQAWFKFGGNMSPDQVADHYVNILLNGCRASRASRG
jgi:TetR/AcrR family transcriptional regulator, cholesterol catabolism regulator